MQYPPRLSAVITTMRLAEAALLTVFLGGSVVLLARHRSSATGHQRAHRLRENLRRVPLPLTPTTWPGAPAIGELLNASARAEVDIGSTTVASSTIAASVGRRSSRSGRRKSSGGAPTVHVLTFADRPNVYLHALAASVWHFNEGRPLHVLGLSGQRVPLTSGKWNITRKSISGTDPGKLKKIW